MLYLSQTLDMVDTRVFLWARVIFGSEESDVARISPGCTSNTNTQRSAIYAHTALGSIPVLHRTSPIILVYVSLASLSSRVG